MEEGEKSFLSEFENTKKKGTLNVLTILTFIGCGLAFIGAIWQFAMAKQSYEALEKVVNSDQLEQIPSFLRGLYSADALEVARKSAENRLPIFIIYLLSTGLCLFGAIRMRQLKMEGYTAWLIGELLPFVGSIIFIGAASLKGGAFYFSLVIVGVFIALYTSQRKNLS